MKKAPVIYGQALSITAFLSSRPQACRLWMPPADCLPIKCAGLSSTNSYIYVATDLGISQFYYLPDVYFPLLLHQYNNANTQGGLVSDDIKDITLSPNGYLYCATASGVSYVHTDSLDIDAAWHKWTSANSPLPNAPILSISANSIYVAMNSMTSVHRFSSNPIAPWQTWTRANGLQDSVFTVLLEYDNEVSVAYGVWNEDYMTLTRKTPYVRGSIAATGEIAHSTGSYGDPSICIYRFCNLSLYNTVLATWGHGLHLGYYKSIPPPPYLLNNCIGFQTISEIKTDANHNIWFGSGWIGGTMTRKGTRGVSKWSAGTWTTYNTKNSPLTSDNKMSVEVDHNNKKWFGSWDSTYEPFKWSPGVNVFDDYTGEWLWYTRDGIKTWNAATGWSAADPATPKLYNNTIAEIYVDRTGNIIVNSQGAGFTVFDQDYNLLGQFRLPESFSQYQFTTSVYHSGSRYFFGTRNDRGLIIWDSNTLPIGDNSHWIIPPPSELNSCEVYGVVSVVNVFAEEENWIATSAGLFMWDGTNWYKYDTDIKRRKYNNGIMDQ